jgi:5-methylcytosine-specific restriction endonuclease McrA
MARARRGLTLGDSYTCAYCLKVIHWNHHRTRPTKDHFFPKSKKQLLNGAKTSFVICCQPCNSRKSDKVFSSIEEVRDFIRSRSEKRRVALGTADPHTQDSIADPVEAHFGRSSDI